jgi:hypothetical protein
MYDGVYEAMHEAGIAELLPEPVMFDELGIITMDETKKLGRPSRYHLTHPEYLLFVDET